MIYGYARESSEEPKRHKLSLEEQQQMLKDAGAETIFSDVYTGPQKDRPELSKMLSQVREGDTIVIAKLDRIAGNISACAEMIDNLMEKGIIINILNIGTLDNNNNGQLIRNIFFGLAELNKYSIVERTSEGRAIKKELEPDWKEGRPVKNIDLTKLNDLFIAYKRGEKSLQKCANESGLSTATFSRRLDKWKKENPNWKEKIKVPEKPKTDIEKVKEQYQKLPMMSK